MILGFDTSNYTTSAAAVGSGGFFNVRRLLTVKEGQRGLRQSDALFAHIKALPELYHELCGQIPIGEIRAAGVSIKPRNVEGSYMPVFLAGKTFASAVADTAGVPLYSFSHQDGHIMAGILSADCGELLERPFLSVHLSGGTTEILKTSYNGYCFDNEIVGKTLDISAGQLIDRIGVKMGLSFPCGKMMDSLSRQAKKGIKLPVSVKTSYINFSGTETKAAFLLTKENQPEIALGIIEAVAKSLEAAVNACIKSTGLSDILMAGGVSSNTYLREYLQERVGGRIYFASPELSTDNAVGIAALAARAYEKR